MEYRWLYRFSIRNSLNTTRRSFPQDEPQVSGEYQGKIGGNPKAVGVDRGLLDHLRELRHS